LNRTFATLLLGLAACAPAGQVGDKGFRDADVPIHSIALFEQSWLEGDWVEVAGYPLRDGCTGGAVTVGRRISGESCYLPAGDMIRPSGPGRFTAGGREFWVLWIDADNRTAVIGTPGGGFGAVLNRGAAIPGDRLEAARRVLAFNGYDLALLAPG
jgi:apolipoprotein D and lipocalin family protein